MNKGRATYPLPFLVAFMLAAGSSNQAAPMFPDPAFDTGPAPRAVAIGDFNGDGVLDAATANSQSDDISVLLGVSDGTFAAQTRFPTGGRPIRIVAADFDGDGKVDLASLGNKFPTGISVLLGDGDGTFGAATLIATSATVDLAVGDLNGDGKVDLAVLDGGFFYKVIGHGDGTFDAPVSIATGSIANSLTIADLNGDGKADVAVGANIAITVHLGIGLGQFAAPTAYPTSYQTFAANLSVTAGDLNADGRLELLSVYTTQSPTPGAPDGFVLVKVATAAGGYTTDTVYPTFSYPQAVVAADLDGDGKLDVAVAGQGGLDVLRGLGNGTLGPTRRYGAGEASYDVLAADLNGDGNADLVTATVGSSLGGRPETVDGIVAFLGSGDGTFGQPRFGDGYGNGGVASGDLNEDGHADLVVVEGFDRVAVTLGRGDGTFDPPQRFPTVRHNPHGPAIGDFDLDGHLDVAVGVEYGVVVFLGAGTGALGAGVFYTAGFPHTSIVAADFNEDGLLDLATNNQATANLSVQWGLGGGVFSSNTVLPCGYNPAGVGAGDVDGDGHLDLVAGVRQGQGGPAGLSWLRGYGDGSFSAPTYLIWGALNPPTVVAVADVTSDGVADILATGAGTDEVSLFIGQGGGAFGARVVLATGDTPVGLALGEVTGDGLLDLVLADNDSWDVSVLAGNGSGGFAPRRRFATLVPFALALGDFDEDGDADIAVTTTVELITLLENRSGAVAPHLPIAGAGPDQVAECASPAGAAVTLNGSGSFDPDSTPGTDDDIVAFDWFQDFGTPAQQSLGSGVTLSRTFALGAHPITLRVTDSQGHEATDQATVTIGDTVPPLLTVSIDALLWPPNHRMVPATASVTTYDLCGPIIVTLESVTSSEPDDTPGQSDGATTGDIQEASIGTPDQEFLLRAERSAGGSGRIYNATYRATDGAGNTILVGSTAIVIHDSGGVTDPLTLQVSETPSGTLVQWDPVPGAVSYDVAVGDLASLRALDPGVGAPPPWCQAAALAGTSTLGFEIAATPAPGECFFIVVSYMWEAPSGYGAESAPYDLESVVASDICP